MKRILILTPWIPYPVTGADQQDRFFGMLQMKNMGYDIRVIAKIHNFQNRDDVESAYAHEGIPLQLFPHPTSRMRLLMRNLPRMVLNPGLLDGATLEYLEPEYLAGVEKTIAEFQPDVIWIEYTTHWSILKRLKSFNIPIIVKSSLNEPRNCIDENGGTLLSRLKSLPKYIGERTAAREANLILGITPDEEMWYRSLGAQKTGVLPLRGLSRCFITRVHTEKPILDAVFLSSNYNMGHNRDALQFLLTEIIPAVRSAMPGTYRFHVTGRKFPKQLEKYLAEDVISVGFVPDIGEFLGTMDVALSPWITGQGMQQKVFEPLCRSIPTMTTKTGGYPFMEDKEVLLCATPEDYVAGFHKFLSAEERNRISKAAYQKSESLFSEQALKNIMQDAINRVVV
ncbi:MAG: glycosyltransferase [Candidatus Peribacteraceae bacterium]|nr:glycosyltransferase [Candidatus Peribacteraceae bacterium]MBP9851001.1 glycosyltransferase [Candidatus Peribacteraceae bacterium]